MVSYKIKRFGTMNLNNISKNQFIFNGSPFFEIKIFLKVFKFADLIFYA